MSGSLYILGRFSDREKLAGAAAELGKLDNLARWDAIDGYFNIVAKFSKQAGKSKADFQRLEGLTEWKDYRLADVESETPFDPDLCHSYVFIETDPARRAEVLPRISAMDGVLFCSPTLKQGDLVAVLKGETFNHIDGMISEHIVPLDGVLRLKQARIISSSEK